MVYTEFYGLEQKPFALLPDPRFLYLGGTHRTALVQLLDRFAVDGGLSVLMGPLGSGKTTLCCTLEDRAGINADIAFISSPVRSPVELLAAIHREYGLSAAGAHLELLLGELEEFVRKNRAMGRSQILVIDDAHGLPPEALDCVRALSELSDADGKLLRILLVGEPDLADRLLECGLADRVCAWHSLGPLDRDQCEEYVLHRMRVGGRRGGRRVFRASALRALHAYSGGNPRHLNALADCALALGGEQGRATLGARSIRAAVRELQIDARRRWRPSARTVRRSGALLAAAAMLAAGVVYGPSAAPQIERQLRATWERAQALWPLAAPANVPVYSAVARPPQEAP